MAAAAKKKDGVRWQDLPSWHDQLQQSATTTNAADTKAAASAAATGSKASASSAAAAAAPTTTSSGSAVITNDAVNRKVCLWRGDITQLRVDAIMNAANEPLHGCNIPNHCIDSAICTAAGPELQAASSALGPIGPGEAVITPGFQLLCPWVIHVVGPRCGMAGTAVRRNRVTGAYELAGPLAPPTKPVELRAGYVNSLALCKAQTKPPVRTFAVCCLSTGMFGYPKEPAAHVAMAAVREWLLEPATPAAASTSAASATAASAAVSNFDSVDRIVFCTFDEGNSVLYQQLMPTYFPAGSSGAATNIPNQDLLATAAAADASAEGASAATK